MNATPGFDLAAWRAQIPLLQRAIPLNHCSQAPLTRRTRAAAEQFLDSWDRDGMDWDAWIEEVQRARAAFARLIHASPEEVAVFSSVSEAASAVASAIDLAGRRRTVVVSGAEFPTVGQIWMAQEPRGARIRWVPLRDGAVDLAGYAAAVDERTAIVSACHGYYLNGQVQDLAAIARQARAAGALVFADAYQTLGALPVDVRRLGVDFLASGCLKYLLGTAGIAFLYIRGDLLGALRPTVTGWFGREDPFAFAVDRLDWAPTARRFDSGTPPLVNAYVARAGMEQIEEAGPAAIRAWLEVLADRLITGGRARGLVLHGPDAVAHKTASTAFLVDDARAVEAALRARGILVSARGPVVRVAPHFYNSLDDLDTALDALAGVVHGR